MQDHNRHVWDERVRKGLLHTRTARDDEFKNPLKAINGRGWITGSIKGKHVLCLAGGGGLQAPLYAAAGAHVTVVDISQEMIDTICGIQIFSEKERYFYFRSLENHPLRNSCDASKNVP